MRTTTLFALLFGLLAAFPVTGQDDAHFEPFSRLAGSCWVGSFPNGVKDRHCWEWALGRTYLKDVHELQGASQPYEGETFYGWDEESGLVRFWYFNSAGGRSEGSVEKLDGEDRWLLVENYSGATPGSTDARAIEMRNFVTFDDDAYSVISEERRGSAWQEVMAIRFVRTDL